MEGILNSAKLELQIIATGMHLSPEFGLTYREIEADGFPIDCKVEMLLSSDTPVGVTKSMGVGMISFAGALADLQPDLLLILGDRYEIFVAASAAMIARIPIGHLHGGEATEGSIDEPIRHSVTKMSHLHFVATEEYRKRVIQLGEAPERIFLVGGLGIDNILKLKLLDRDELEAAIDFKLGKRNLLVTFHPVTLEDNTAEVQMNELLSALELIKKDTHFIFTMPNADTDGRVLFEMINDFVNSHKNVACVFTSLGQIRYLSCIKHVDGVVGNSSSGLLEVPSFKKGTINIGDRQRGRLKADSVIDCDPIEHDIKAAFDRLFSDEFRRKLESVFNPYGSGGSSQAIVNILENTQTGQLLKKRFYNLEN